jgi:hypothetical protein
MHILEYADLRHFKASIHCPPHLNLEVNMGIVVSMDAIVDHLDSKNLVPFKKRRNGYHLPGLQKEAEEQVIEEVDPELRPEEQGYVRHYLAYADVMLKSPEQREAAEDEQPSAAKNNVTEMRKRDGEAA